MARVAKLSKLQRPEVVSMSHKFPTVLPYEIGSIELDQLTNRVRMSLDAMRNAGRYQALFLQAMKHGKPMLTKQPRCTHRIYTVHCKVNRFSDPARVANRLATDLRALNTAHHNARYR